MAKLELPKPGEIWCVPGIQGSRKSSWLKAVVAANPTVDVVVADFCDEWSQHGRPTRHVTLGPLTERTTTMDLYEHPEVFEQRPLRIAVVLTGSLEQRAEQLRDLVVDHLEIYEPADRELVLIIEECFALGPFSAETFGELAALARHAGLGLVLVSQFHKGIHHSLRRQSRFIAVHQQEDKLDVDALSERMPREMAEKALKLAPGERIIWRGAVPANPRSKRKQKE